MFRRLLKHQLYSTYKLILALYSAVLVLGVLCGILAKSESFIVLSLVISLLSGSILVLSIIVLLQVFKILGSSIYGNEGYLTLTLPVSSNQLLFSKCLSVAIYIIGLEIDILLSAGIAFAINGYNIFQYIYSFFFYNTVSPTFVIIELVLSLIYICNEITCISFALAIANNGKYKHRNIIALVIYGILNTVVSFFKIFDKISPSIVYVWSTNKIDIVASPIMNETNVSPLISFIYLTVLIGSTIGFYLGAKYFIDKKINIE